MGCTVAIFNSHSDLADAIIYRETTRAALDQLHAAQVRITKLERDLADQREELRRYARVAVES